MLKFRLRIPTIVVHDDTEDKVLLPTEKQLFISLVLVSLIALLKQSDLEWCI